MLQTIILSITSFFTSLNKLNEEVDVSCLSNIIGDGDFHWEYEDYPVKTTK